MELDNPTTDKNTSQRERWQFFLKNLLRGLLFLILLVAVFIYAKNNLNTGYIGWLAPIYEHPTIVYLIYTLSELLFGIIPPEIFMIWALRDGVINDYVYNIAALAVLSYAAGISGYWIGRYLNSTVMYRFVKRKVFGKYEQYFNEYGGFLIIVAAMTPLPYSGVSMLVGAARYSFRRFLYFSLTRFVRYFMYSYLIWEAHYL